MNKYMKVPTMKRSTLPPKRIATMIPKEKKRRATMEKMLPQKKKVATMKDMKKKVVTMRKRNIPKMITMLKTYFLLRLKRVPTGSLLRRMPTWNLLQKKKSELLSDAK